MSERLIHPIEYQMATTQKTVLDLLNEHYDHPSNCTAELPDARLFAYIEHVAALALRSGSLESIALTARAYRFAATVGDLVGYDGHIIKASQEFGSSKSFDQLQATVADRTDHYIADNMPTVRLIDTYSNRIDTRDNPDMLAVRSVTATIMRQMQQGNEEATAAREIAALEALLATQTDEQPN